MALMRPSDYSERMEGLRVKDINAKALVKEYGLTRLVGLVDGLSSTQLAALAKIADDYGKSELAQHFNASLRLRKLSRRKVQEAASGSMLEAVQCIDGLRATPYAWFSNTRDGRVIVHTWRRRARERDPWAWRRDGGVWTSGVAPGDTMQPEWASSGLYTQLLNAFDDQAVLHGDRVYATLSTDVGDEARARQKPGSNTVIKNSDGSPAVFRVEFDTQRRWHRLTLLPDQDADISAQ
jgi:hypothetical protein